MTLQHCAIARGVCAGLTSRPPPRPVQSQPGTEAEPDAEDELGVQSSYATERVVDLTSRPIIVVSGPQSRRPKGLKTWGGIGKEDTGALSIATTPTQARYALPAVVQRFIQRHPRVRLNLHEGSPDQIVELVAGASVDIGIVTEFHPSVENLVMLPCYQWNRGVITPPDHPLLAEKQLTLEAIARHPIVTYDFAFNPDLRSGARSRRATQTNVVLTLSTRTDQGLRRARRRGGDTGEDGFDPARDTGLRLLDARHLFEPSTTRIAYAQRVPQAYVYDLIELFARICRATWSRRRCAARHRLRAVAARFQQKPVDSVEDIAPDQSRSPSTR